MNQNMFKHECESLIPWHIIIRKMCSLWRIKGMWQRNHILNSWFIQIHTNAYPRKIHSAQIQGPGFQIGTHVQIYFIQDVVYWYSLNFVLRSSVSSRSCEQDSTLYSIDWRANMEFSYLRRYNWACIFLILCPKRLFSNIVGYSYIYL